MKCYDLRMDAPQTKKRGRMIWQVWVMLALPYLALCFPVLYVRMTPVLFGFPFFYWYQFLWVVITSLLLFAVYRKLKSS
jgi:hypothetical protein